MKSSFLLFCSCAALLVSLSRGFQQSKRVMPQVKTPPQKYIVSNRRLHSSSPFGNDEGQNIHNNNRFQATAPNTTSVEQELILTIDKTMYNLTAWANAHPGGVEILRKFQNKNATKAFFAADHSQQAIKLLESFQINAEKEKEPTTAITSNNKNILKRWKSKLVSREDPFWIHKGLGIYALLHFIFRLVSALFGADPAAGMGSNLRSGQASIVGGLVCLIPHLLLSYSSLIFNTVPRERVVGKPMIWKESRWHSIVFGSRSIFCSVFCWLSIRYQHAQPLRTFCILGTSLSILFTMLAADLVTAKLKPTKTDSTIATMPFWDGCSPSTQSRIKHFYAYAQFGATSVCALVANPVWPFLMLFPIQFASLLFTLCRKGLISAKTWHIAYAASLLLPFVLAIRVILELKSIAFIAGISIVPAVLFGLRCLGVNKYAIWIPALSWRLLYGDQYIPFQMW